MNQPDPMNLTPYEQTDTVRLWLSDQQWLSLLSRVEQGRSVQSPDTGSRRRVPRYPARLRCAMRLQQRDGRSATYMIHTRNLSSGGVGFVHSQPLEVRAACTIVLQTPANNGRICAGRIAWCRPVTDMVPPLYEIGVTFDQPIDLDGLVPNQA